MISRRTGAHAQYGVVMKSRFEPVDGCTRRGFLLFFGVHGAEGKGRNSMEMSADDRLVDRVFGRHFGARRV